MYCMRDMYCMYGMNRIHGIYCVHGVNESARLPRQRKEAHPLFKAIPLRIPSEHPSTKQQTSNDPGNVKEPTALLKAISLRIPSEHPSTKHQTPNDPGNVKELTALLKAIPLRIRAPLVRFRNLEVSIEDLFTGTQGHVEVSCVHYKNTRAGEKLYYGSPSETLLRQPPRNLPAVVPQKPLSSSRPETPQR